MALTKNDEILLLTKTRQKHISEVEIQKKEIMKFCMHIKGKLWLLFQKSKNTCFQIANINIINKQKIPIRNYFSNLETVLNLIHYCYSNVSVMFGGWESVF